MVTGQGVRPCSDCSGIQTRLTLRCDDAGGQRFELEETYLGAEAGNVFTLEGGWRQLHQRGDGGPALADMVGFLTELEKSMTRALTDAEKNERFVRNVLALGNNYSRAEEVQRDLKRWTRKVNLYNTINHSRVDYGYARLDAFGRIYNRVLEHVIRRRQLRDVLLGVTKAGDDDTNLLTAVQVDKALEKFGLQQCRVVSTPEAVGAAHDANPALDKPADRQRYMEMTGTLMYAAISTRPDIAHAVHYLASNMQAPTQRHMQAAERVFRYLAGTKALGLVFGSRNGDTVGDSRGRRAQVQVDVCAFSDADWANDKGDRRSITGWVAKLNGDPVSWSSKKQRVVALSTCEAELYAESAAIQEVLWLRGLMEELGLHTQTGSTVYGDNQSAIAVSENGVKGERTKHVDVKYHFVTQTVERGDVKLRWVPTTQQQADIFTKALAAPVFEHFRRQLMAC